MLENAYLFTWKVVHEWDDVAITEGAGIVIVWLNLHSLMFYALPKVWIYEKGTGRKQKHNMMLVK